MNNSPARFDACIVNIDWPLAVTPQTTNKCKKLQIKISTLKCTCAVDLIEFGERANILFAKESLVSTFLPLRSSVYDVHDYIFNQPHFIPKISILVTPAHFRS